MEQNWKLLGMWVLLDALFALLIFSLAPLLLGIQIAKGLLFYAQFLIYIIALILIISTFIAFHKGCMVNLRHSIFRTADSWWRWIVFHWGLGLIVSLAGIVLLMILGPLLASSFRYLGIFLMVFFFFWLIHYVAMAQYCFLKRWLFFSALKEAWIKKSTSRFHGALYTLALQQVALLALFLFVEFLMRALIPEVYLQYDRYLIGLYFIAAAIVFYIRIMKNRLVLFG